MTRQLVSSLTVSLLLLAAALVLRVVLFDRGTSDSAPAMPGGTPPVLPVAASAAVAQAKTEAAETEEVVSEVGPLQAEQSSDVASYPGQTRITFSRLEAEALVLAGGEPVEGASVVGRQAIYDPQGYRVVNTVFADLSRPELERTGPDGLVRASVAHTEGLGEEQLFGLAAYHPDYGSSYVEVPLRELKAESTVILELERGRAITGRVVDKTGAPLEGAWVWLATSWPKGEVPVHGVGILTAQDGSFFLSGIRFGNTPLAVHVRYFPLDAALENAARGGFVIEPEGAPWTAEVGLTQATFGVDGILDLADIPLEGGRRGP